MRMNLLENRVVWYHQDFEYFEVKKNEVRTMMLGLGRRTASR